MHVRDYVGVAPSAQYIRAISFEVETGMDINEVKRIEKAEKLKPIELELRMIEQMLKGIVDEMEYLKEREIRMRDTNESTNERVASLSLLSMALLIGSGLWQIYYLRRFFQSKKLM
jgi:p24 family protein delta-1